MSRILNNTKALVFIIAILLISNIAILVFFMGSRHTPLKEERAVKDRPGFTEFLKKEVGFSPQQLKQYDSVKKVHWKTARSIFKGMNTAKDSLYIHVRDSIIDDQFLLNAADSIAQRQKQLDLQMFAHFRDMRRLCTQEQKPVFDSLVQGVIRKMMNPYRRDNRPKGTGERDRKPDSSKDKKIASHS